MPTTLIVSYSRTGGCDKLADAIAGSTGWPVERIESKTDYKGLLGFLRGGSGSMRGLKVEIEPPKHDASKFEEVLLIFPIWAGNVPPPVAAYLERNQSAIRSARVVALSMQGADTAAEAITSRFGIAVSGALAVKSKELGSGAMEQAVRFAKER